MRLRFSSRFLSVALLLLSLPSNSIAYGNMENMNMSKPDTGSSHSKPETYFQYGEFNGWIIAHISFMIISWVFILPVAVILSISRSRYSRLMQCVFLLFNGVGIGFSIIYNINTPDMYSNNAHHKLGWYITWFFVVQIILGVIPRYSKPRIAYAFSPISQEIVSDHQNRYVSIGELHRYSHDDSGHGTEVTASPQSSSSVSMLEDIQLLSSERYLGETDEEKVVPVQRKQGNWISRVIPRISSRYLLQFFGFIYDATDRLILFLGFAAICTGWITYGGLFKGSAVFSGLAHFIKGGVFFWVGILTLGRWAGCFAEIGWAWNLKSTRRYRPTAEFVESFLIFFYGITNVFLEHLAGWGAEWTATDLEHVSLTVMFFGGGLCGMLIESTTLRTILNVRTSSPNLGPYGASHEQAEPATYQFPMNPLPALIIILLGKMMSSHHQESMVSTMLHSLWGVLLMAAAFARLVTYFLLYLSPPKSIYPGRPPTELLAAFCFMAGGLVFMGSARDVIETVEMYHLDAMFVFSVTVGVVTILMAWIIVVIGIKGWAVRRENRAATSLEH